MYGFEFGRRTGSEWGTCLDDGIEVEIMMEHKGTTPKGIFEETKWLVIYLIVK